MSSRLRPALGPTPTSRWSWWADAWAGPRLGTGQGERRRVPEYRADVDGLRALAIIPVMFFHAGFEFAQGGFVGVDVFFVISGYLITSLILWEVDAGRFSLDGFYERRVRRLFPALLVMLLACSLLSTWLLLPQDLRYFGGSVVATTLFSSNVFFWLEAGYFDIAAERKPLLHTWSLGVEEQYYLLLPVVVLLLLRYLPRRMLAVTVVCTLTSLVASEWVLRQTESAAFYLAPFRAWELGLGAILALAPWARPRSLLIVNCLAFLGIGLIAASVAMYSWRTPFPGLHALLPCAGAALVIWTGAGTGSFVGRILSNRILVLTGLVSYSLYLWHWPLLVFARLYAIRELTTVERLTVLLVSAAVAIVSWRFVELPFRGRSGILARGRLFALASAAMVVLCVAGLAAVAQSGWPQRFEAGSLRLLAGVEDRNPREEACSYLDAEDLKAGHACLLGRRDGTRPSFIVWGDSHADALMPTFDRLAAEHGQTGLYLGKIGCPPLLEVERDGSRFRCREFNESARNLIESLPATRVVLAVRWSHYTSQPVYGGEERSLVVVYDGEARARGVAGNDEVLERGLDRTLGFLRGRQVFVVSTVPEVGYDVPRSLAQARHLERDVDIRPTVEQYRDRQRGVEAMLASARRRHGFIRIDPASLLCSTGRCQVEYQGMSLYVDSHHLSRRGAEYVAGELAPVFK